MRGLGRGGEVCGEGEKAVVVDAIDETEGLCAWRDGRAVAGMDWSMSAVEISRVNSIDEREDALLAVAAPDCVVVDERRRLRSSSSSRCFPASSSSSLWPSDKADQFPELASLAVGAPDRLVSVERSRRPSSSASKCMSDLPPAVIEGKGFVCVNFPSPRSFRR